MTHYAVLGMPPGSTEEQLHAEFLELARLHHPDAGGDTAKFQQLTAAWGVLKDPVQRKLYDAQLRFDGGNCSHCEGRGLVFRYKIKGDGLCDHCAGTGRIK
jgi:curved DNA-binding protein